MSITQASFFGFLHDFAAAGSGSVGKVFGTLMESVPLLALLFAALALAALYDFLYLLGWRAAVWTTNAMAQRANTPTYFVAALEAITEDELLHTVPSAAKPPFPDPLPGADGVAPRPNETPLSKYPNFRARVLAHLAVEDIWRLVCLYKDPNSDLYLLVQSVEVGLTPPEDFAFVLGMRLRREHRGESEEQRNARRITAFDESKDDYRVVGWFKRVGRALDEMRLGTDDAVNESVSIFLFAMFLFLGSFVYQK